MKTVYVNNLGYLKGPNIQNADTPVEVSEETAKELSFCPLGRLWRYNKDTNDFYLEVGQSEEELRTLREFECFAKINRSFLWYLTLTETQKIELQEWYMAWLDVTETGIIPEKPTWLN